MGDFEFGYGYGDGGGDGQVRIKRKMEEGKKEGRKRLFALLAEWEVDISSYWPHSWVNSMKDDSWAEERFGVLCH